MIPIQLLRKVSIFQELADGQLEEVAALCTEETHSAGSLIRREGEPAEQLLILREGKVVLEMGVRLWPERRVRQMSVETINAGEPFGLSALTESEVWTMSARALDTCRVIVLRSRDLRQLMEADPIMGCAVNEGLSNVLAHRLRHSRLGLTEFLGHSEIAVEQTPEESTAIRRIQYGINFRWLAIVGVILITAVATQGFGISFPTLPILLTVTVIALYNLALWRYAEGLESEEASDSL